MEWKCLQYLLFRKVDNTLILVFPGLHKITLIRYKRFKDWLTTRNPFTFEDSNLYSLSTGFISIAGEDEISCDDSERIGANTQAGMNGKRFTQVRFKRNDQAKPLDWWLVREYSNHRWSESIYQLNSIVYEIIRCCKKTGENEESYFYYEMTNEPCLCSRIWWCTSQISHHFGKHWLLMKSQTNLTLHRVKIIILMWWMEVLCCIECVR